jgi:hypothetical protein
MGARTTALLLVLVLGTAAFLWRDPDSRQILVTLITGQEFLPPPEEVVPLADVGTNDVVSLELRVGERRVVMQQTAGKWTGPLAPAAVEEFLASLRGIGRLSHIPVGDRDLAEFGLDEPQRSVQIALHDPAESIRIDVGDSNPAATSVYVRINQVGPIVLAGAVLTWEIDKLAGRSHGDAAAEDARP